ncbi:hypothetical protein [Pedobacter endophyticus]|uniref:Uncharacterized protein n=1 Tax=Pedobacter endophyticus TaxID=2789740 RepID=A0A7S9L0J3_9SPHI|nr:hypothetical protein [Pedobacter endophyticus]QPH40269.1 hypothetical protein IZT61_03035 [Pedobacter endophyticus]
MKQTLLITIFALCTNLLFAQQIRSIDYQYERKQEKYYAFELFESDTFGVDSRLFIDFAANDAFKKVKKITLSDGSKEFKLKFGFREEQIKTDNPALNFYPIVIAWNDVTANVLSCEAKITFELDNGAAYSLPFDVCLINEILKSDQNLIFAESL